MFSISQTVRQERQDIWVSEFVELWDKGVDSFKADPPNATLSVLTKDGDINAVVELKSVEQKSGSVVFKVAVLEGTIPGHFKAASIFIDAGMQIFWTGKVRWLCFLALPEKGYSGVSGMLLGCCQFDGGCANIIAGGPACIAQDFRPDESCIKETFCSGL